MDTKMLLCYTLRFLLCCTFIACISTASQTISPGHSLSGEQTITSPGGTFELGFFTPGTSQNYYIGIWQNVDNGTVLWVANRQQPVSEPKLSLLELVENGNLTLSSPSKVAIWSTNSRSKVSNSSVAKLLDNGNFVITDAFDSSVVIWQSFDHLSDTWLTGAELGYNNRTKRKLVLTSWRNLENPAPGPFSFELDKLPFDLSDYPDDIYPLKTVTLEINGQLKFYAWNQDYKRWIFISVEPLEECAVQGSCGAFSICYQQSSPRCGCLEGFEPKVGENWKLEDYSDGCVRKTPFHCSPGDLFLAIAVDEYPKKFKEIFHVSFDQCRSECLINCSCTAFAYNFSDSHRCYMWTGDLYNISYSPDSIGLHLRIVDSKNETESHTISPGQSLSGGQTITSPGGTFELGFFTPGNSRNYYIGIWKNVNSGTVLWVANRQQPVSEPKLSLLELVENGNLTLSSPSKVAIWSTNSRSKVSNSSVAKLLDNGNFVITDAFDSSVVIWQSFDHLSDTWLPGAELGYNNRTKRKQVLTSWRNLENPAPGPFSFELHELPSNYLGTITRATLEINGQLKFYAWDQVYSTWNSISTEPWDQCEVNASCGAFSICYTHISPRCGCLEGFEPKVRENWGLQDFSDGCVRKIPLHCSTCIVIGVLAGFFSILSAATLMVFFRRRWSAAALATTDDSMVLYKHRDLRRATKNFSEKLGEGAFGSVFKGMLPNSTAIAVKQLKFMDQGEKQFRAEVGTIGVIQHNNIIRMRGFCTNASKRFLVYDYMPNGSLQSLLLGKNPTMLDWKARYHIAVGTARGLAYLHEECRDCIIHCDVKPENILLDSEYSPKLADFGLAKLLGRHHSRVLTTMRGTVGYLAPEWFSGEAITPKADVFSYGMLLIEVISGRRNREGLDDGIENFRPIRLANAVNKGEDLFALLDCRLEGQADGDELSRACKVACWCIQEDEKDRPTMKQVVQILEAVLEIGVPPVPQFLQRLIGGPSEGNNYQETTSGSGSWSCSDVQSAFQAQVSNSAFQPNH